jgi:hypothetical protein
MKVRVANVVNSKEKVVSPWTTGYVQELYITEKN